MTNKKLLVSAIAVLFSITTVQATDITGVAGNNGVYNINPEKATSDTGYRHYNNFDLSQGDVANLIYKHGNKNIDTFINMVNNKVNINGIVNTMRDGAFHNGHAVFISPNGMVVGASGVLNVGSLSVLTPSVDKYNRLLEEYSANNVANINQLSKLKMEGRNADVTIEGKIFARNGVTVDGSTVAVPGAIVNGVQDMNMISDNAAADILFNSLVNTNGINQATTMAVNNGSVVFVRSGEGENNSVNVSGTIANLTNGETALVNHGDKGMNVTGLVAAKDKVTMHNTKGEMVVNGTIVNENGKVFILNRSNDNLTVGKNAQIVTDNTLDVLNYQGDGHIAFEGAALATDANIVNKGADGMIFDTDSLILADNMKLNNKAGQLDVKKGANVMAGNLEINSVGANIDGRLSASQDMTVTNKAGELAIGGLVENADGTIRIFSQGDKLVLKKDGLIAGSGDLAIKNNGAGGMVLDGDIAQKGNLAINNLNGQLMINGNIQDMEGNMAIVNRNHGTDVFITKNANIEHKGDMLKLVNVGEGGMIINGNVKNEGKLYITNDGGLLIVGANADPEVYTNIENKNGTLYISSRKDSKGINITSKSVISNEGQQALAIRHNGTGENERGIDIQGIVMNDGETAINNYNNDMFIGGEVISGGKLGVVNRGGSNNMLLSSEADIIAFDDASIKHEGSGNMTVNSEIAHFGRLDVLDNSGKLNMGAKVTNEGAGTTYIASRKDGKGVNLSTGFEYNGNGELMVRNISGEEGLRFVGNITNKGGQTVLSNEKGAMVVGGSIDNTGSEKAVILTNKGDSMTVRGTVTNEDGLVKVVDRSGNGADLAGARIKSQDFVYEEYALDQDIDAEIAE